MTLHPLELKQIKVHLFQVHNHGFTDQNAPGEGEEPGSICPWLAKRLHDIRKFLACNLVAV